MGQENYNLAYSNFKRFENEILIDTYDSILKSNTIIAKETILHIGSNEIFHILKYHQKIALNAFYFNDINLLLEHQRWLYRVYFHKNIDLSFFIFLIETFEIICSRYIDNKVCLNIFEFYRVILDKHKSMKDEAYKKKVIIDNLEDAKEFSNLLVSGEKEKAYAICKANSKNIEEFLKFYNEVVFDAMKNIGYMWECGDITVAKEHIASNSLDYIISKIVEEYPQEKDKEKHIFLSSAPHETHGLGLKVASLIFEKLGYKVTNLGISIPSSEIKRAIMEFKPNIIIFSATLQTSIIDIALLINDINKDKSIYVNQFKIGIAGNAFENMIHPRKMLKADFYMKKLGDISKY